MFYFTTSNSFDS